MHSNRSNTGSYGTARYENASALRPPWALSEENSSRSASNGGANRRNNNTNNNSRTNGRNNGTLSYAANSRGNDGNAGRNASRSNRGPAGGGSRNNTRTWRYGRRLPLISWFDRDLPLWLNFHPATPRTGPTDVHTVRNRERRSDVSMEDRRLEIDESMRSEVTAETIISKDVLTVVECDLHMYENTKQHRTNLYECTERDTNPQLVVRRGQQFTLTFTFQRPYRNEVDDMSMYFNVGKDPSEGNGTSIKLPLIEDEVTSARTFHNEDGWVARVVGQSANALSVMVFIPANAIVGEWKCVVVTHRVDMEEEFEYEGVGEIFVLFNPWCSDDQVYYFEDPQDLNEYILNPYGCVFEGSSDYISRRPWFYGQFENQILDIVMSILRLSYDMKVTQECSDVISVTRNLSHILNASSKSAGVMVGNWSGDYSDGKNPMTWSGSVKILKQFGRLGRPVKYAQCFVFCHLFTTVCRALGIPCRSLTNFESAHDTDKTATIDSYEDEEGNDLRHMKSDSIWNYHCWNDVWINRPDLDMTPSAKGQYSGWHAVDATPQEASNGRYQCGPSPLTAIKNGEISIGFDTQFIYGEVNGEVCTWMVPTNRHEDVKLMEREPNAVGMSISTKEPDGKPARGTFNPGSREVHVKRKDITDLYKYPEGSREERESLKMAVGDSFGARMYQEAGGLTMEFAKVTNTLIGSDFELKVYVTNKSSDAKEFDVTLSVMPIDYRGERIGWDYIAREKMTNLTLWPSSREVFLLPVPEKKYLHFCDSSVSMLLHAFVKVKGQQKPMTKMKKLTLKCPEITLVVPMGFKAKREQSFTATASITNPTNRPMTHCMLNLGGTIHPMPSQGFTESDGTYTKKIKDIFPNEVRTISLEVRAQRLPLSSDIRELDVDVESTELPTMSGSLDITVL